MSNLLSTDEMVAECKTRVPIGLSSAFWMKKLNEAYRWISQKGNFIWDIKAGIVNVPIGSTAFGLPSDCDPGKPIWLAGPSSGGVGGSSSTGVFNALIPYQPWDESLNQQYAEVTMPPGMFSCWTFATFFSGSPPAYTSYTYVGQLFPASAAPTAGTGAFTLPVYYHTDVYGTEFTEAANVYFPTPNSFDNLLIELAESEARRIYGLAGWDIIQKRAESAIVNLLDSYRSTKNVLSGLMDQQKQVSEKQMMAQERG